MEISPNLIESSETKALVCHTDMSQSMQDDIITICLKYWNSCHSSLDTPACIKNALDKKYGSAWHCIIGDEYNSCVTHDSQCFLDFKFEKKSFMVYKTSL
ncbi:Dynein light chain [Schistosoma japonicum]|uniref:Dynein light chain n=1 Tax=Schistosoma japonicum TaxID=6182 RepID=A0A4Z2D645_SCHJA|nr:Dynein light chain 2, cytoplasmic [Schistosoma japonicum]TNN11926.1 Dynein light chain [Schistosoma japonicum]